MITYINNVSGYTSYKSTYTDSMFWENFRTEYNARKETKINKITVYKDGTLTNVTKQPYIQYNNTLTSIKEIWVGDTRVYGSTYEDCKYPIVASYLFYYNGAWKYSNTRETVALARVSLGGYTGSNILYGVYIKPIQAAPTPDLYIQGTKTTVVHHSGINVYGYNGYIVAIHNETSTAVTRINLGSNPPGSWGNIAFSDPNRIVNIPPYSMVFYNLASVFGYNGGSGSSGSSSGTGAGESTGSATGSSPESSSTSITATGKVIAYVVDHNGSPFNANYITIPLNFEGITSNYHAAL